LLNRDNGPVGIVPPIGTLPPGTAVTLPGQI
jgi:hypothetical protein